MDTPKFDGKKITIGGTEYVIPPLSFRQLKTMSTEIKSLAVKGPDNTEIMLRVIQAALSRNYPEMTLEQIEEIVDLGNILEITQAVMGGSGFVKTVGEILAGSGQSGTISTPTS
jgi:hypothetical protein